jgi:hypothetical protein
MKTHFLIQHRANNLELLSQIPTRNGAEIDVRYHNDKLILEHEPFGHHQSQLVFLEDYLKNYRNQGPLILNVKSDGLELKCIELMHHYRIQQWFFLDLTIPSLVRLVKAAKENRHPGFTRENLAIRFSEKEPFEFIKLFIDEVRWLWVDCFTTLPMNFENVNYIKKHFKVCLVSPELQGHSTDLVQDFKEKLRGHTLDAVCTKHFHLWTSTT